MHLDFSHSMWRELMTNKVTLNALSRKHAQLQTDVIAAQNHLDRIQTNLNAIEITIGLIDPSFDLKKIKPLVKYSRSKFKRGQVPFLVGEFVRERQADFSCPQIVSAIRAGVDFKLDSTELEKLNLKVYNSLTRLESNGIVERSGKASSAGAAIMWSRCN